jgi:ATPase subunit of ABC transporter with duplicated ATPase domains
VLFVSHDRWFVSELATRILEITPEGPRDFPGTYPEYLERCGDDHLDADAVVLKAKDQRPRRDPGEKSQENGASWEEQKRRRNRLTALPARRDKLLASIDQAEGRRRAIEQLYAEPGFFQRTAPEEVQALQREDAELATQIERWLAEWEEVEKEIASLG